MDFPGRKLANLYPCLAYYALTISQLEHNHIRCIGQRVWYKMFLFVLTQKLNLGNFKYVINVQSVIVKKCTTILHETINNELK